MSKLFRIAFEEGCGISFDKVVRSREFCRMLKRELSVYDRYPEKTWRGRRLRQNHFGTAFFANAHYRGLKLTKDDVNYEPKTIFSRRDLVYRALLKLLGKKLINRAKNMLSDRAIELAGDYQRAESLEGRIEAIVMLYYHLSDLKTAYDKPTDDPHADLYGWVRNMTKDYPYKRALPHSFGKFGEGSNAPLCICMAIMLCAWARLAKAPVMLGNMVSFDYKLRLLQDTRLSRKMIADIDARGLILVDNYRDSFMRNVSRETAFRGYFMDMHAGIVVGFASDGWMFCDPYLEHLGVMMNPNVWQAHSAYSVLTKISDVIPGFTLVSDDGGQWKRFLRATAVRVRRAIKASHHLEANMPTNLTADQAKKFLRYSQECGYLRQLVSKCCPKSDRMTIIVKYLFGFKAVDRLPIPLLANCWLKFETDSDYQAECKKRLLSAFHVFAFIHNHIRHKERENGVANLPEDLEFSLPEFTLALHVINNLAAWSQADVKVGDFFLKHSTSSLLWGENVLYLEQEGRDPRSEPRVQAAAQLLEFLDPHIHDFTRHRMQAIGLHYEKEGSIATSTVQESSRG